MYIILALNSQSSICLWSAQRFLFFYLNLLMLLKKLKLISQSALLGKKHNYVN